MYNVNGKEDSVITAAMIRVELLVEAFELMRKISPEQLKKIMDGIK